MKSQLVTPDGKVFDPETLESLGQEEKVKRLYELTQSGIKLKTDEKPKDALDRALMQVRESYGQQVMAQMVSEGASKEDAYMKAQVMVGNLANPFQFEPAARAVFLAMVEEIHYLRGIVDQLSARVAEIDGKEIEDPGPLPEAK